MNLDKPSSEATWTSATLLSLFARSDAKDSLEKSATNVYETKHCHKSYKTLTSYTYTRSVFEFRHVSDVFINKNLYKADRI